MSEQATGDASNVVTLCSILGIEKVVACNLLDACKNDVQLAVQMHYETGHASAVNVSEDNVRAPIPPKQEVLMDNPLDLGFAFRGRQRPSHRSAFDKFRDFAEETREHEEQERSQMSSGAGPSGSRKGLQEKRLERLYRPPFDLMFTGTFKSARDAGNSSFKWLMVNVQNSNEFACQVLNRDVWSNDKVKDLVKEHFIFWQVYHDSSQGSHYMNLYPVESWPYVAIIDPRTGECLVTWCKLDEACFCDLANVFLSQYNTLEDIDQNGSQAQPRKKKKIVATPNILDADESAQLAAAIQASLGDENHTPANSEEDMFHISDSSCEEIDASFDDAPTLTNGGAVVVKKAPTECWRDFLGLETDAQCQMRLFTEASKEVVSMPLTSKLKALLLYAQDIGYSVDEYVLETHFPKKSLSAMDPTMSLQEAGLSSRETVYITRS